MSPQELAAIVARIEALPVHPISGYEWECDKCSFWWHDDKAWGDTPMEDRTEAYHDQQGNACDHRELLDKRLVLAALGPP